MNLSRCVAIIFDQKSSPVTKAKFFSILADEVRDTSNKEQMSLVIRFFDVTNIEESFVDFIECENLDGDLIASKLICQLKC